MVAQRDECTQGDSPVEGDQIWMLFLNKNRERKKERGMWRNTKELLGDVLKRKR
jgi:hypothetical protein